MATAEHRPPAAGRRRAAPSGRGRRFARSLAIVVAIVVAISLVAGLALAWWLNSSLKNVTPFDVTISDENRLPAGEGEELNILLMGVDAGEARGVPSILEAVNAAEWPRGRYRSDAMMLLHIPPGRERAYVISIPRDSYVRLYDERGESAEMAKVNAALSLYGPSSALATVENLSGLHIDHLAIVDWEGFEDITDSLGGVTVTVPGEGRQELNGAQALDYVRERYGLRRGDFDRVRRQQNFLRAVAAKLISRGTIANPPRLKSTLDAITSHLAVDEDWSTSEMRSLALSMRDVQIGDIRFLTIPTSGTDRHPRAGSIVVVDEEACSDLFTAIRDGNIEEWLDGNPDTLLTDRVD